jgi:hypothetical protein
VGTYQSEEMYENLKNALNSIGCQVMKLMY